MAETSLPRGYDSSMETLRCLSTNTTDGQPCQQIIADDSTQCAAGHPLVPRQRSGALEGGRDTSSLEVMPEMTFDEEDILLDSADASRGSSAATGKIRYNPLVNGVTAKGVRLTGEQLRQHLRDHEFRNFYQANFRGSDLSGEDLTGIDLMCARLQGANLAGIHGHDVRLWGARLDGANLRGARFIDDERAEHDSIFAKAVFTGADLTGAAFETADLKEAVFTGANLAGASFRGSDLRHTDFRGAKNVGQVDFTNADLYGARFDPGAEPEGWVPYEDSDKHIRTPENPSQGAFSRYFSFTDYRFDGLVKGAPRDKHAEGRRLKGKADEGV